MSCLIEEVIDRQPPDIKEFLLRTSILERMTGALCNAVTGRNDGQAVLEWLEAENMFIIPLDSSGEVVAMKPRPEFEPFFRLSYECHTEHIAGDPGGIRTPDLHRDRVAC